MASLSEYEEEDRRKASSVAKPFSAVLDPSDPLGFLEKVFEFVARESDSLVRDVNAVVRMVNDKVEAEERKRSEAEKKAAEMKAAPVKKEVVMADKEAESKPEEAAKGPRAPNKLNGPESPNMTMRAGYTTPETELICTLWAEATLNSRKGADQKAIAYWGEIKKRYNVIRPTGTITREVKQIKSHFQRVQKEVKVWEAIHDKCKSNQGSGMGDDQIILQAQEIFRTNKNAHFKYLSAWRILRESQRCASIDEEVNSSKRTKNTSEGGYTTSYSEPSITTTRPTSQKVAKKNNKGKGKSSESPSSPSNWESIFADHFGNLKQVNRYIVDHQILITDTSRMGALELARHNRMVNEIVKRRGWDH